MSTADAVGLIVATLLVGFLLFALLRGERL